MTEQKIIAPSILNANNLDLKTEINKAVAAGITRFHIDIMDGHFVPNLSFGPQLVADFKREFPMVKAEVHLMSDNPKLLVPAFVKAGADLVEIHYEAMDKEDVTYWLDFLRSNGVKGGLVLNPETSVSILEDFASKLDQVLIMTVHPGFGGQKFLPESPERIKAARALLDRVDLRIDLEVDGGINYQTAAKALKAGANVLVVGSYIFASGDISGRINKLGALMQ